MSNKSISQLTAGGAVTSTDIFPDVQTVGIGPVKVTAAQIGNYVLTGVGMNGAMTLGTAGATAGTLALSGSSSGAVTLQVPASNTSYSITLPSAVAAGNGYILTSTTGGVTSWSNPTSLGIDLDVGSTAITNGAVGRLLFEGAGNVLQESANLTFSASTLTLGVAASATGAVALTGATSGTATITAQATAGTPTLTLPNTSGTLVSTASSPLSINATTGAISITGAAGQVLAGATPAFTSTPTLGVASSSNGSLTFARSAVSYTVTLQSSSTATATWTLTLPTTAGSSGQALITDGSGNASWGPAGSSITDDTTTNATEYPLFSNTTTGSPSTVYVSSTKYTYNPSTGTLSVFAASATNGVYLNAITINDDFTVPTNYNGGSFGPVTVAAGKTVTVSSGSTWTVV